MLKFSSYSKFVSFLFGLCSLFVSSQPDGELSDLIRLFFQIELAHWFFLDFYCTQEENLIFSCGLKQFALNIFEHIPFLNHHVPNLNVILEEWKLYKMSVPTYGTILLTSDMQQCLLVQSFFAKNSWSFPKGKVNENEDPVKCAIREVYEETGFDCSHLINPNDFVEGQTSNYQYSRLYIVKNVPIETKFCPRTRNEIKDCSWFKIDLLPTNRNDDGYIREQRKIRPNSFYMILPFISKLKHWIMTERLGNVMRPNKKKQQQHQQLQSYGQKTGNKKNSMVFTKQPSSPFFHNNFDQQRNGKQRNKSTGDTIEPSSNAPTNGTFYNDHLKMHNNTSTPIAINNALVPSRTSAFRPTNSDVKSMSSKKKPKTNGKLNQTTTPNGNQDQFKRRLFNEAQENIQPTPISIKPFKVETPECWKNFRFDRRKLHDCIYGSTHMQ